ALRSCQRRRPLLRGGRSAFGRVPRQLPAGADTPGTDQRGGRDRRGVEVIVWGALAGGAVGTTMLASGFRLAQELGWTRMDIPFLLGTVFTENRRLAVVVGWGVHLANGLVFALLYAAVFAATGLTTWWFGLVLGAVHAGFVGGALVNLMLPAVHPRMGTPWTDAEET